MYNESTLSTRYWSVARLYWNSGRNNYAKRLRKIKSEYNSYSDLFCILHARIRDKGLYTA